MKMAARPGLASERFRWAVINAEDAIEAMENLFIDSLGSDVSSAEVNDLAKRLSVLSDKIGDEYE